MNNQQRKRDSLLVRTLGWTILMAFCNTAAAIEPSVKADNATTPNIECMLNWAQTFYPNLFSPAVQGVQFSSPYTYRYYPITNSYVGVSSTDNHVYYLGPDDVSPKDIGHFSDFMKAWSQLNISRSIHKKDAL